MNQVEMLTMRLCPNGVPMRSLGAIGTTVSGLRGKSKDDFSEGNAPYVSYVEIFNNPGIDFVPEKRVKVHPDENQSSIQLGDVLVTGSSETRNECGMTAVVTTKPEQPIYLNSFCFIWRPNKDVELDPQFMKHLFRDRGFRDRVIETANGVTRQNISKPKFLGIEIPVPPISVQREIASVLNKFSELEAELKAELEAELEARKSQYVFYRESLFSKRASTLKSLDSVTSIWRGRRFVKDDIRTTGVPAIHYGEIYTKYGLAATEAYSFLDPELASKLRFVSPSDVVLVSAGETIEDIGKSFAWFGEGDAVIHDACYGIRSSVIDPRYMVHFFNTHNFRSQLRKYISSSKISAISTEKLGKVFIPVPSLEEQKAIADVLDSIDRLVSELSVGIPTEIAARRQQYEYYRTKLLTFKTLEAA